MGGWDIENLQPLIKVMDKFEVLDYELRHCVRGAYTGCKTNKELASYIKGLVNDLSKVAEELEEDDNFSRDQHHE